MTPMHIWCPWCRAFVGEHDADGVAQANQHTHEHADVAPTATEVEETYVLAPRYVSAAAVRDTDQPPFERGTMRILASKGNADEVDVTDGKTVADYNPEHPPKAPVYECVFEGWLDSNVPNWREEMLPDVSDDADALPLAVALDQYAAEWGLKIRTYDYPATRLCPRPTCADCGERLEWTERREAYICPNSEHISPDPTCEQTTPIAAHGRMGAQYDPYSHGDPKVLASGVQILGTGACPVCEGEGHIDAVPEDMVCPACNGSGFAEVNDGEE